jgi:hypothetical protein
MGVYDEGASRFDALIIPTAKYENQRAINGPFIRETKNAKI